MPELRLNRLEVIQIRAAEFLRSMTLENLVESLDDEYRHCKEGERPKFMQEHIYMIGYYAKALLYQRDKEIYDKGFVVDP